MTSEELAQEVEDTIRCARERITGVGNQQYSGGRRQRFENLSLGTLVRELQEELLDVINYSVMLQIRLHRITRELAEATVGTGSNSEL